MVDVRTITTDETDAFITAFFHGFHKFPPEGAHEAIRPRIYPDRTYAAFDGDAIVGTARSFPSRLSVPGRQSVPVAAVTNVTVRASRRRRGVVTELMRRQLDEVADRGEAVAILIASEAPIYGRFGYGPVTEHARIEVDARTAQFVSPTPKGDVRFVDAPAMREAAPAVYERFFIDQPGAIERSDPWWDASLGITPRPDADPVGFLAVYAGDGDRPDGYVRYLVTEAWVGRAAASTLVVKELVAATDAAYDALWRLVTSADWVTRVSADDRPSLEALPWLVADPRAVRQHERSDFLWARLLDVAAALTARTYRFADRLVLDVVDAFRPSSGGRFALDAGPDGATCEATEEAPDLTLNTSELAAAYLGSTPLWPAAAAGRAEEHHPGAVDAFDRLFLIDRPAWCHTWF